MKFDSLNCDLQIEIWFSVFAIRVVVCSQQHVSDKRESTARS